MNKNIEIFVLSLGFVVLLSGCSDGPFLGTDIRLFKAIWPLAQAVKQQDIDQIEKNYEAHPDWINQKEPQFGKTILIWAVEANKTKSVQKLLELRADPNLQDDDGQSAVMYAAGNMFGSECLKLVTKFGGDVNDVARPKPHKDIFVPIYKTPLISSVSSCRLENMKILVNAGAKVEFEYGDANHWTALKEAVIHNQLDMVSYLLIEKHAQFKNLHWLNIDKKPITICDMIEDWKQIPKTPENVKEIRVIVGFLKSKGINCEVY